MAKPRKGVVPPQFKANAAKKAAGGAAVTPPSVGGAMPMAGGRPAFLAPVKATKAKTPKSPGRSKGKSKGGSKPC